MPVPRSKKPVLIIGGAGFIGSNLAHRFLQAGQAVIVYDALTQRGVEKNLEWLRTEHGSLVDMIVADVRDRDALRRITRDVSRVFHFAARAGTDCLDDPSEDFEVNVQGTANVLEALRGMTNPPPFLFASTNEVYGDLSNTRLHEAGKRCMPVDPNLTEYGFNEDIPLQFSSSSGCSKGCAEQYVLSYARNYNLPAVAFRLSCVYGPHQFGNESHGWLNRFLVQALSERPITIYDDGLQVSDVLFVTDLVNACLLAHKAIDRIAGRAFNLGGGPDHSISVLEAVDEIEKLHGKRPSVHFEESFTTSPRYYVSDTRRFSTETGWVARIPIHDGIRRVFEWLCQTHQAAQPIVDVTHLVRSCGPRDGLDESQTRNRRICSLPTSARFANAV